MRRMWNIWKFHSTVASYITPSFNMTYIWMNLLLFQLWTHSQYLTDQVTSAVTGLIVYILYREEGNYRLERSRFSFPHHRGKRWLNARHEFQFNTWAQYYLSCCPEGTKKQKAFVQNMSKQVYNSLPVGGKTYHLTCNYATSLLPIVHLPSDRWDWQML